MLEYDFVSLVSWADATLEVYNVKSCDEFAIGPMHFTDIKLWDENMSPMTPSWLLTGPKVCGGTTVLDKKSGDITIEHKGE
eukprot:SAG31_NODE_3816_length_3856_cov_2.615917_3_plen_81_part_00